MKPEGRHSWPLRAGACAAAIAGLDADLIGLQEVRLFQERGLARRLPGYAGAGAGRDDGRGRGERCTVVYSTARLRLEEWTVRWLSDTPWLPASRSWGNPIPRIATLCRFLRSAHRRALRAGRHALGRRLGAPRGAQRRGASRWLDSSLPWLVVGDLNATAADPAVATPGRRRPDRHARAPRHRGAGAGTHHPWDGSTDGTRIDYVLADPGWEVLGAAHRPRPARRAPAVRPLAGGGRRWRSAWGRLHAVDASSAGSRPATDRPPRGCWTRASARLLGVL